MKITLDIWSERLDKSNGGGYIIESHITLTDEDIEKLAEEKFKDATSMLRDDRKYYASIDKIETP